MKNNQDKNQLQLECETLEERQMLSTVDIFAAGVTNEENIELQIDGVAVQSWENIGGDAYGGQFVKLTYSTAQNVDPGQIRIAFTNDAYDEAAGIDRNVRIDKIVVDGETIQTESANVFSTGTWRSQDGIAPGSGRGDILHSNGYFQFPASQRTPVNAPGQANGSVVDITVRGSEGTERFNLLIKGQAVATFDATQFARTVSYTHNETVNADDVRIEFLNDQYDPANGIDANLIVDKISIDGTVYQTEDPSVFSNGTWKAADGIVAGNRQSETLHVNGYFQFAGRSTSNAPVSTPTPAPAPSGVSGTPQDDDVIAGTPRSLPGVRSDDDVLHQS